MSKYRKKDPHRKREAEKYTTPVPSREYISQYLEEIERPVTFEHLLKAFDIKTEEEQEGLRRRLIAMSRDGQLMSNRRGSFALVDKMSLVSGRVLANRDGSGFLKPDDGSEDIFLPSREMSKVFNLDRALVSISHLSSRGRREGSITEVLERNTHQVVGRFYIQDGVAFVDPNNKFITQDIIIPAEQQGEAKPGQFVVAEITLQPSSRRQPMAKVVEILGDQLTPGMEVELAVRAHSLPFIWPQEVIDEAQSFRPQLTADDLKKRVDLRAVPFATIDGEDAKDFDDAIYCEKLSANNKSSVNGWRLQVAIADVSHYVRVDNVLDVEAKQRGNSVYFPNKVIPMLPEILSNGLCSLNPKQDRLVLVCNMEFNEKGEIKQYKFQQAVIHSYARLTYTAVAKMLQHPPEQDMQAYEQSVRHMHELFQKLYQLRQERGALDFDTIETRVIFDSQGKIDCIVPVGRNDAHRLIEEAMLQANTCAAAFLSQSALNVRSLYRVHEGPTPEKLLALRDFLKPFGLRLTGGLKPTPKDYSKLLQRIGHREDAPLLQLVLLRSLRQAIYATDNIGHFGLAYETYTHFTSPIRRYPDLLVHRAIKFLLERNSANKFYYDVQQMKSLGEHCSVTERRADLATRDAMDWLKCHYMQDKVGQVFAGTIADVTSFGIFVQLKDIFIQGLVHITALRNDYYTHEPVHHLLRGRKTNQTYRLGDHIQVLVARVDLDQRQIDFELAESTGSNAKKKTKTSQKSGKDKVNKTKDKKAKPIKKEKNAKRNRRKPKSRK